MCTIVKEIKGNSRCILHNSTLIVYVPAMEDKVLISKRGFVELIRGEEPI